MDRLIKALEVLGMPSRPSDMFQLSGTRSDTNWSSATITKSYSSSSLFRQSDARTSAAQKKLSCSTIAETLQLNIGNSPFVRCHLPLAVEALLGLQTDCDSDVRRAADESLNKIVHCCSGLSLSQLTFEFYRTVKQNGPPRVLCAAFTKFSFVIDCVSCHKKRVYAANMVACLTAMAARDEFLVQETLCTAFPRVAHALAVFLADSEVQTLLAVFVSRLAATEAVCRRCSVQCIVNTVSQCRRPHLFLAQLVANIVGLLDEQYALTSFAPTDFLSGYLWCLRDLIPLMSVHGQDFSTSVCYQLWCTLLRYSTHSDHNVATAALEALWHVVAHPSGLMRETLLQEHSCAEFRALCERPKTAGGGGAAAAAAAAAAATGVSAADDVIDPLRFAARDTPLCQLSWQPTATPAATAAVVSTDARQTDLAGQACCPLVFTCQLLCGTICASCCGHSNRRGDAGEHVSMTVLSVKVIGSAVSLMPAMMAMSRDKCTVAPPPRLSPAGAVPQPAVLAVLMAVRQHWDPQVRGAAATLCGACLSGVCDQRRQLQHQEEDQQQEEQQQQEEEEEEKRGCAMSSAVDVDTVFTTALDTLHTLLLDTSHVPLRPALAAAGLAVSALLAGHCSDTVTVHTVTALLTAMASQSSHSYWLIKVSVCESLSSVSLLKLDTAERCVRSTASATAAASADCVATSCVSQLLLLLDTYCRLLADCDPRVQRAASRAIARHCEQLALLSPANDGLSASDHHHHQHGHHQHGHQQQYHWRLFATPPLPDWRLLLPSPSPSPLVSHSQPKQLTPEAPPGGSAAQSYTEQMAAAPLSAIVARLVQMMASGVVMGDAQLPGPLLALQTLMQTFPVSVHPYAWQVTASHDQATLYRVCLQLLTQSHHMQSLPVHTCLLYLTTRLAHGVCWFRLRRLPAAAAAAAATSSDCQSQQCVQESNWQLVRPLVAHLMRLLNLFSHLVNRTELSSDSASHTASSSSLSLSHFGTTDSSSSRPTLPSPSSESSKQASEQDAKQSLGTFASWPEYVQLYNSLSALYKSAQLSVNVARSGHNVFGLLDACLAGVTLLLPAVSSERALSLASELVAYLGGTIRLAGQCTVACLNTLLDAVFSGCPTQWEASWCHLSDKMAAHHSPGTTATTATAGGTFYDTLLNGPLVAVKEVLTAKPEHYVRSRAECSEQSKAYTPKERVEFASRVKLFEPAILAALNMYTTCSDVQTQWHVLQLLRQLLTLNASYHMLDPEQLFIGYMMQQLSFIEEGQLRDGHVLLPALFDVFVLLTRQRLPNSPVATLAHVIQLCDHLRVSGLAVDTCVCPAVAAVAERVFVFDQTADSAVIGAVRQADRDALFTILLQLSHHPPVLELIGQILLRYMCSELSASPTSSSPSPLPSSAAAAASSDCWRVRSGQLLDAVVPALASSLVHVQLPGHLLQLQRCLSRVCVDTVSVYHLLALLLQPSPPSSPPSPPPPRNNATELVRWSAGCVCALFLVVKCADERALLDHISKYVLCLEGMAWTDSLCDFFESSADRTAKKWRTTPQLLFIRYLFVCVDTMACYLAASFSDWPRSDTADTEADKARDCVLHVLCQLMHLVTFIVTSGCYDQCARGAVWLLDSGVYRPAQATAALSTVARHSPLPLLHWCSLISILNYGQLHFWTGVVHWPSIAGSSGSSVDNSCQARCGRAVNMSRDFVRRGGLILICDYLCSHMTNVELLSYLLMEHVLDVLLLVTEPPVSDLIGAIHRNSRASALLLQSLATNCSHPVVDVLLARRVLQCLQGTPVSLCGPLLSLMGQLFFSCCYDAIVTAAVDLAVRKLEIALADSDTLISVEDLRLTESHSHHIHPTVRGCDRLLQLLRQTEGRMSCCSAAPAAAAAAATPCSSASGQWFGAGTSADYTLSYDWLKQLVSKCLSWKRLTSPVISSCASLLDCFEPADTELFLQHRSVGSALLKEYIELPTSRFTNRDPAITAVVLNCLQTGLQHFVDTPADTRSKLIAGDHWHAPAAVGVSNCDPYLARFLLQCETVSVYLTSTAGGSLHHLEPLLVRFCLLALQLLSQAADGDPTCFGGGGGGGGGAVKTTALAPAALGCIRLCLNSAPVASCFALTCSQQQISNMIGCIEHLARNLLGSLPTVDTVVGFGTLNSDTWRRLAALLMWADQLTVQRSQQYHHQQQQQQRLIEHLRDIVVAVARLPVLSSFSRVPHTVYAQLQFGVLQKDTGQKDRNDSRLNNSSPVSDGKSTKQSSTSEFIVLETQSSADKESIDDVKTESSADKESIDDVKTESSADKESIDVGKTESSADNESIDVVKTESSADKESIDVVETESSADKESIDDVMTESSADKECIDDVMTESSVDKECIDVVKTESSADKECIDIVKTESSVDKECLDVVKTESSATAAGTSSVCDNSQLNVADAGTGDANRRCVHSPAPPGCSERTSRNCINLSAEMLMDIDVLRLYINRIETVGWFDRRDFEEVWMSYLTVLNATAVTEQHSSDERAALTQIKCLVLRAATDLILDAVRRQTLHGGRGTSGTLHRPREVAPTALSASVSLHFDQFLSDLQTAVDCCAAATVLPSVRVACNANVDRLTDWHLFGCGQISVQCLRARLAYKETPAVHCQSEWETEAAAAATVDVYSCVVFLLQLFESWLCDPVALCPVLVSTVLHSLLLLSDWLPEYSALAATLLHCCVSLWPAGAAASPPDDPFSLAPLIVVVCKLAALVDNSEPRVLDTIRSMMAHGLGTSVSSTSTGSSTGSSSSSCVTDCSLTVFTLHAALYLLQTGAGHALSTAVLAPLTQFVGHHFYLMDSGSRGSQLDLCVWATLVYLMRHYNAESAICLPLGQLVQHAAHVAQHTRCDHLYQSLLKGLERLVVYGCVSASSALSVATDLLYHALSPTRLLSALTLTLACLYTLLPPPPPPPPPPPAAAAAPSPSLSLPRPQLTATTVVEIYAFLLTRLRSVPDCLARALSPVLCGAILRVCSPAQLVNRTVAELVSAQQVRPCALALAAFHIVGAYNLSADRQLIVDWLLYSVATFLGETPQPRRSRWQLCCLMVCVSLDRWLRASFPLLLTCENDLRSVFSVQLVSHLLTAAACDFSRQLTASKRVDFIGAIENSAHESNETICRDLLSAVAAVSATH